MKPTTERGAISNPHGRFAAQHSEPVDDGWIVDDEPLPPLRTTVRAETARSIVSRNDSPDLPFRQSINPYRGCEHGCIYCYARPTHAYLDLSPGLAFETQLFYKHNAAPLLAETLRNPRYEPSAITLGANTDPYQPIEREHRITRALLEVFYDFRHPLTIITKSALIARDLDLLQALAAEHLVQVMISLTSLDPVIKRTLEPRAAGPQARLRCIRLLADAGVPVGAMIAPVIPAITDHEIEDLVAAAAQAGARTAAYVLLRLPHEVAPLFREWLQAHHPLRAAHVMSLIQQARGGRDNDPRFGHRMRGEGPVAQLIAQRFRVSCRRHGLDRAQIGALRTDRFRRPPQAGDQLSLF